MKLTFVALAAVVGAVSAAEVAHLTKDTFKDWVAKEPLSLVGALFSCFCATRVAFSSVAASVVVAATDAIASATLVISCRIYVTHTRYATLYSLHGNLVWSCKSSARPFISSLY
jgi:hypothetical protein